MQTSIQAVKVEKPLWRIDPAWEAAFIKLIDLEGYDHKNPVCSLTLQKKAAGKKAKAKAYEALRQSLEIKIDKSTKSERRALDKALRNLLGDSVDVRVISNERSDILNGTSPDLTPKPYAIFFSADVQTQKNPKVFVKASSLTITGELRQEALSLLVSSIVKDLAQKGFGDKGGIFRLPPWKVKLINLLKRWPSHSPLPPISEVEQFSSKLPPNPIWKIREFPIKDLIRFCHVRIIHDGAYKEEALKRLIDATNIFYLLEDSGSFYPDGPAKNLAIACKRLRDFNFFLPVPDECVYRNRIGMNIKDKFRGDLAWIAEEFNVDPAELLFLHVTLLRSELRSFEVYGCKAPHLPPLESIELRELAFLKLVDQKLAEKLHHEAFRALKPKEYDETRSAFRDKLGMSQTESEVFLEVFMEGLKEKLQEFSGQMNFEIKGNEKRYPSCYRKMGRVAAQNGNLYDSVREYEDLIRCMIILKDDDRESLSLTMEHLRDQLPQMTGGRAEKLRVESEHGNLGAFKLSLMVQHPKNPNLKLTLEIQVMTESFYYHKYSLGATHKPSEEMPTGEHQLPGQVGRQTSHIAYKHGQWTESFLSLYHGIPRESVPRQEYLVTEPELTKATRDERVKEYLEKARKFVYCEAVNASHSIQKENERGEIFAIRAGSNLADLFFAMKPSLDFELTSFKVTIRGSRNVLPLDHKLSPFETYVVYPPEKGLHSREDVLKALDETTSLLGLLQTCPERRKRGRRHRIEGTSIKNLATSRLEEFGLQGAELAIAKRLGLCKSDSKRVPPELYFAIVATYPDRPNKDHLEGKPGDYILSDDYLRSLSLTLFSSISAQKFSQSEIQLKADEPLGLEDFINILNVAYKKGLSLVSCSKTVEQDEIYYTSLEFSGENLGPKLRDLTKEISKISRPRSSSIHIGYDSAELVFNMEDRLGALLGLLKHLKDAKNSGRNILENSILGFRGVTCGGTELTLSLGYSSSLKGKERMVDLELKSMSVGKKVREYLSKDSKNPKVTLHLIETGKVIEI
jgi:hypothetical protein